MICAVSGIRNSTVPVEAGKEKEVAGIPSPIHSATRRRSVVNLHDMADTDSVRFMIAVGVYQEPIEDCSVVSALCVESCSMEAFFSSYS